MPGRQLEHFYRKTFADMRDISRLVAIGFSVGLKIIIVCWAAILPLGAYIISNIVSFANPSNSWRPENLAQLC
jgi:hypothetical protein